MAAGISLISIALSFFGSFDTVRLAKSPPTLAAVDTMSIQGVINFFAPDIEDAKKEAQAYFEKRQWKGRLASKDISRYNDLVNIKNGLIEERNNAILTAEQINEERKAEAQTNYEQALLKHENEINKTGGGLGFICIFCQILLWVCYYWQKEFYFQIVKQTTALSGAYPTPSGTGSSVNFTQYQGQSVGNQPAPSSNQIPAQQIGFRLSGTLEPPEDQINDDLSFQNNSSNGSPSEKNVLPSTIIKTEYVIQSDSKRNCDHCGTEYIFKSSKSRYCGPACRKAAYKLRNQNP